MELINYDEIIKRCKEIGIDVTWRKLNYYKFLGLLPTSQRIEGDKRGYYPVHVIQDLWLYHFMQRNLCFTLDEIRKLVKNFGYSLSINVGSKKEKNVFGFWIRMTYGYFFRFAQKEIEDFFDFDTITASLVINEAYKKELQKGGISQLYKQMKEQEQDVVNCKKIAKEWAKDAIESLKEIKSLEWYKEIKG